MENEPKATKFSSKAITIHQLNFLVKYFREKDESNDFQLLLLTPFGFIKGDLEEIIGEENFFSENENLPGTYKVDLSYAVTLRRQFFEKLEAEESIEIVDNGAILNFKNAQVFTDNLSQPIATFDQHLVFADQIISFSIVPRQID